MYVNSALYTNIIYGSLFVSIVDKFNIHMNYYLRIEIYITVNSAYVQVRNDTVGEVPLVYSKLWRCKALLSSLFTAWRVIENKVSTRVNLERCGVLIENPLCCLCGMVEESSSHLFSVYDFAWRVWCLCFKWLGVSFVIHKDPLANFFTVQVKSSFRFG